MYSFSRASQEATFSHLKAFVHNNGWLVTSPTIDRDIWAYWSHYCCAPWRRIHSTCLPLPLWTCYVRWVEARAEFSLHLLWYHHFFSMTEMVFSNFTTEQTAYTTCTWWLDERMKEPKLYSSAENLVLHDAVVILFCFLPWSLTIAISGQSIGAVTTYYPSLADPWVNTIKTMTIICQLTFTLKIRARFNHKNQWWRPKDVPPLQRCCSSYVEALGH